MIAFDNVQNGFLSTHLIVDVPAVAEGQTLYIMVSAALDSQFVLSPPIGFVLWFSETWPAPVFMYYRDGPNVDGQARFELAERWYTVARVYIK